MAKSPSEFSKMYPTFWSGKTGKALRGDAEAQVIQHYLIDNAHSNMWGLYHLPKAYIIHDTGHSEKVINRALKKLAELSFAYYDEDTEYVFVVEMAHIQVGPLKEKDNRIASANKYYQAMPDNPFLGAFYDRYASELSMHPLRRGSEGGSTPLARGSNDVDADGDGVVGEKKELQTKDQKDPSIDSTIRRRRFSDDPQHLIDLWNEMVVPLGLSRVDKLTPTRREKIYKAYKVFSERVEWEEICLEFQYSLFLQNKRGTNGHMKKDFDWLLSNGKDGTENYIKARNGRYRDDKSRFSEQTQRNIDEMTELMREWGISDEDQKALTEGRYD
jgi:hypothetical protein